jgi:hypothetical protein
MSKLDDFKDYVARNPTIREEVLNGKKTWQQQFENWTILGETATPNTTETPKATNTGGVLGGKKVEDILSQVNLKNIWGYVKKINLDSIGKTLNTVQKVLAIAQNFQGNPGASLYNANYNSWWD